MELFQLRSFLRVAEEGSVTRAAESLHLTQPAVTQHVRGLERELGARLFDRTERGMRLTQAGETLRREARQVLARIEEARAVIADQESGVAGRLVLGAGVTTSIFQLPAWLRAFQDAYPGIDVAVRTGRSREVAGMTLERQIDLGLITSPIEQSELTVVDLYAEEIIPVTPPGHPMAGRTVSAAEWAGEPLILFPQGTGFRDYLDRSLAAAGVAPHVKMESDSAEAIKSFVAVGLGVSFLPAAAVAADVTAGALGRVYLRDFGPLRRRTAAIYRTDRYLNAGARGFLEILRARTEPVRTGSAPEGAS